MPIPRPSVSAYACYSAILIIATLLVYTNTLHNSYAIDDFELLVNNEYVQQGLHGIPRLLTTTHLQGAHVSISNDYYRPLALVMFAAEHAIWGNNTVVGHFFNVLLFSLCVYLLFHFLVALFGHNRMPFAFIAALLFAVHPVHTEVVANIKSRDELLSFFFAFSAMLLWLSYAQKGKIFHLLAGCICLLLGILSKQTVITFVAIVPLVFFFYSNAGKKRSFAITITAILSLSIYTVLWYQVQLHSQHCTGLLLPANAAGSAPLLPAKVLILGFHLWLLFIPWPLNVKYDFTPFTAISGIGYIEVILTIAIYAGLFVYASYRLFKYRKDLYAFGILFFLITISLFSNIIRMLGQPMANRYEFLPSVGFCIVIALLFEKWVTNTSYIMWRQRYGSIVALTAIIASYAMFTIVRNTDWKDSLTVVLADLKKSPSNPQLQYSVGLELLKKAEKETDSTYRLSLIHTSINHLRSSIFIYPAYTESHSDLGSAYFYLDDFTDAENQYKATLQLNARHLNALNNLAMLYFKEEKFDSALRYYSNTNKVDTSDAANWYHQGICFAHLCSFDSAILCLKKAARINSSYNNYGTFGNLAILYKTQNIIDSANKYEQLTRQSIPGFIATPLNVKKTLATSDHILTARIFVTHAWPSRYCN